jgi:MFS family permease
MPPDHATQVPKAAPGSTWAPFAVPAFRALWIAGLVSDVGAWMHGVGAGWLMTSLTASPRTVSLLQAVDGAALFLLALPAGALADIVDRRRLAIGAQLWLFVCAASMAWLAALGALSPPWLIGFAFAMGMGSALNEPLWQALTAEVVPRSALPAAVTLDGVSMNLARSLGPALGGVVVALAGPAAVFGLNALTFLWVTVALVRFRPPKVITTVPAERWVGAMAAGLRYVRHTKALRAVLFRCAASVLPGSVLAALLPLYARGTLRLSAAGFGLLLGCMGLGALLAAWQLPAIRARVSGDHLLTLGALAFAGALVVLYAAGALILAAFGMVVAGVGWMTMLSGLNVAAQLATASWVRARVLSVYMLVFQGALALGSFLWGEVATRVGVRSALLAAAAALAASLVTRVRYPIEIVEEDMTPSLLLPMPKIVCDLEDEDGPVRVLIEYNVPEVNARAFSRLLRAREQRRRRDGAIEWGLYRDVTKPTRWLETFVVDSWGEHERQHSRTTATDRRSSARIAALLEPGTGAITGHFIASGAWEAEEKANRAATSNAGGAAIVTAPLPAFRK